MILGSDHFAYRGKKMANESQQSFCIDALCCTILIKAHLHLTRCERSVDMKSNEWFL